MQTSVDDYMGIMYCCHALRDRTTPRQFLEYGLSHLGFWNNVKPGKKTGSAFLARFLPLMAAAYWASGRNPGPFLTLAAAYSVHRSTKNKGTDDWVLSWFLLEIAKPHSTLMRHMAKRYSKALKKRYQGGLGDVIARYYQSPSAIYGHHPAALFLKGQFGE
jgi:hypothetical protein